MAYTGPATKPLFFSQRSRMYCENARSGSMARAASIGQSAIVADQEHASREAETGSDLMHLSLVEDTSERSEASHANGARRRSGARESVSGSPRGEAPRLRKKRELLNHHLDGLRGRPCGAAIVEQRQLQPLGARRGHARGEQPLGDDAVTARRPAPLGRS